MFSLKREGSSFAALFKFYPITAVSEALGKSLKYAGLVFQL